MTARTDSTDTTRPAVPAPAPAAPAAPAKVVLTAVDRCDTAACGAQARAVVTLVSGGQLVFCRHHTELTRDALEAAGAHIDTQYAGL